MEKTFSVVLEDNYLSDYEPFLKNFNIWKDYKREVRLKSILNEGKRIELDIEMESHQLGAFFIEILEDSIDFETSLSSLLERACIAVINFKFIINGNKVDKLDISCKILNTYWGKTVQELINNGIDLKMKQKIAPGFVKFYLTN